jgi:hypothetical protein
MLLFMWICFLIFLFVALNQKEYNAEKFGVLSLVGLCFIGLLAELSVRHPSGFVSFVSCSGLIGATILIAMCISGDD